MLHLLYNHDLVPCDFWLLPALTKGIRGRNFQNNEEVMNAVHTFSSAIPAEEFATMIKEKWVEQMRQWVAMNGRYFEKEMQQSDSE